MKGPVPAKQRPVCSQRGGEKGLVTDGRNRQRKMSRKKGKSSKVSQKMKFGPVVRGDLKPEGIGDTRNTKNMK